MMKISMVALELGDAIHSGKFEELNTRGKRTGVDLRHLAGLRR